MWKVLSVTFSHVLPPPYAPLPHLPLNWGPCPGGISKSVHVDVLPIIRWIPFSPSRTSYSLNDVPWSKKTKLSNDVRQSTPATVQAEGQVSRNHITRKDLMVLADKLNLSYQCTLTTKGNHILGCISKNVTSRTREVTLLFYSGFVTPHVKCSV